MFRVADMRREAFSKAVHDKCMELLRLYLVVGGLPEAVAAYARNGDAAY